MAEWLCAGLQIPLTRVRIPTCPLPRNNFYHQIKILEAVLHNENSNFRIPKDLFKPYGATLTHGIGHFEGRLESHRIPEGDNS